jgi:hypothetical protein
MTGRSSPAVLAVGTRTTAPPRAPSPRTAAPCPGRRACRTPPPSQPGIDGR